jgi:hypothetical protein
MPAKPTTIERKIESITPAKSTETHQGDLQQSPADSRAAMKVLEGHPAETSPDVRRAAALQLQQTHGNQAVQRLLKNERGSVQRDPISAASLGMAVFASGQTVVSQGGFNCTSNTPSYQHQNTPASETWENVTETLHIAAHHPRYGFGDQHFYFRLSYERNGYDIRNAVVNALKDQSSTMVGSSLTINWGGQEHSNQSAPVAQIVFNISNSVWDPIGLGQASFWGQLIISASKSAAAHSSFTIGSEQDWVWVA